MKISGLLIALIMVLSACGSNNASVSLLPNSQQFQQSAVTINTKVDVLWVVDNSSSMTPLQTNLLNNFHSFMSTFQAKNFDFQLAVTTTDAYLADPAFHNDPSRSLFRDGLGQTHTGVPVIIPTTMNLVPTFITNAAQGDTGSGDERAFSSFRSALNNPGNSGFLRPGSFLAVVILSDEDDFSGATRPEGSWIQPGGVADHDYNAATLDTVDSYVSYLDQITNSTSAHRNYNVSAVTVADQSCLQAHQATSPAAIMGQRYIDIATKTNGVLGSICDTSYSNSLNFIQQKIVELTTQYYLTKKPDPNSIVVTVDGLKVPQGAVNGWTYEAASNSIQFHGSSVPSSSSKIAIGFDTLDLSQN